MKMKTFFAVFLAACLLVVAAGPSFASCTEEQTTEDQDSSSRTWHGQSFTASCSGKITSIRVQVSTGDSLTSATLEIFADENLIVAPLYDQSVTDTGAGDTTITLSTPLNVTSGNQYTFVIKNTVQWKARENSAGGYADGQGYDGNPLGGFQATDLDFTVTIASNPTIASITPSSGTDDGTVNITNLSGTDFQNGATVKLQKAGESDITATGVTVVDPTQITCTFDLAGAAEGNWDVVVTHTDTTTGTLSEGFTITPGAGGGTLIPTVDEWGMMLLLLLMAAGAYWTMRRKAYDR